MKVKSIFGPQYREVEIGEVVTLGTKAPMPLECGAQLQDFPIAFQTYGTLSEARDNAILICHGLTGDQYAASPHPVTGKPGWWGDMIGSGKPIDTDEFFVICPNVLGGCMGSHGPKEIDTQTCKSYGPDFPIITIADMVDAQKLLIDHMGIERLFAVIGGSMGGMQVLQWAHAYPHMMRCAIPISTAARHTAQNIAFHEIGRQAIMADPDWCGGRYQDERRYPSKGLSVARMTAHVTYLSQDGLARKFGRELQDRSDISYGFDADFQIESYLRYQGINFVERFDPNSYLYITRAMDYFDLSRAEGGLAGAFKNSNIAFCVVSFSSDWLFPPDESKLIVQALAAYSSQTSFVNITSDKGHDAFLLDEPLLRSTIAGFLRNILESSTQLSNPII